jgi:hypothetical protein
MGWKIPPHNLCCLREQQVWEADGHQPARASAAPCILAEKVLKEVLRYAQAGHMGLIASAARLLFPEDAILECEE